MRNFNLTKQVKLSGGWGGWGRVFFCSPGCPGTYYVAQAGLELVIILPQPPYPAMNLIFACQRCQDVKMWLSPALNTGHLNSTIKVLSLLLLSLACLVSEFLMSYEGECAICGFFFFSWSLVASRFPHLSCYVLLKPDPNVLSHYYETGGSFAFYILLALCPQPDPCGV
jgi:hypothetical protein